MSELVAVKEELEQLKAQTAAATVNSEQAFHRLEQDHLRLKERYEKGREELRNARKSAASSEKQRVVADAAVANLKSALSTKEAEAGRLERSLREVKEEKDGLLGRVTRLLEDSRERNAEMQTYATRLEESYKARHDLQEELDKAQGTLRTAQFDLHRVTEAKELSEKHSAWLTEELETKQKELAQLRAETGSSSVELQQKADDAAEEATKLAGQVGALQSRAEGQEQRIMQLERQVQEKSNSLQEHQDRFTSDLMAREQLEKLLKESLADSEAKVKELTSTAQMLHDRTGTQDKQHTDALDAARQKQAQLEEELKAARAELAAAAAAPKTAAAAAPAAESAPAPKPAAALPNDSSGAPGMRISDVVAEKIQVESELRDVKLENKRLNNYLNSILIELEQKAPQINEQREAYEKAVRSHARMATQLEGAKQASREASAVNAQLQSEVQDKLRLVANLEATNAALGLQIQRLEAARQPPHKDGNAGGGRQDDIPTLQMQNQELLKQSASLQAELERTRQESEKASSAQKRGVLEAALAEVESMRQTRARQEEMVAAIVHQRDVYRELLQSGGSGGGGGGIGADGGGAVLAGSGAAGTLVGQDAQAERKEFEIYRKEQKDAFKMLEGKLEATQQSELAAQTKLAGAEVQLEHAQQRYSRQQEVLSSKKSELQALETKHAELKRATTELQQRLVQTQEKMTAASEGQRRVVAEASHLRSECAAVSPCDHRCPRTAPRACTPPRPAQHLLALWALRNDGLSHRRRSRSSGCWPSARRCGWTRRASTRWWSRCRPR
jgi:nucleoprotein TPR